MRTAGGGSSPRTSRTRVASGLQQHTARLQRTLFSAAFPLGLTAACAALAAEPTSIDIPTSWAALEDDSARPPKKPKPDLSSEIEARKSYSIPALEIIGFDLLLNQFDRHYFGGNDYDTDFSTIKRNLHHSWVVDNDPYKINQFGHPYQGSMYHGFARSAGLNFWESFAYTFAGSIFWEIAGETTPPSKNDQVASGIGGTFVGEPLFRMASLVLEKGNGPSFWREVSAAAISPATGFNRLAFEDRFDRIFASRDPAYYSRLQLGVSTTTQNVPGASTKLNRDEVLADFSMDYGLPGKPGYAYDRPFDYFSFQGTASSANGIENVMTRGLLFGKDYGAGENYRGVWDFTAAMTTLHRRSFV